MTFTATPHINFRGQARDALDFYEKVFEGKKTVMTYGAMGQEAAPDRKDQVIWGEVSCTDGFRIMAFDILPDRPFDAGTNAFFVALQGDMKDQVQARWDALSDGATILQPIGPSSWSPLYGMLTDRFGVTWIVGLDQSAE